MVIWEGERVRSDREPNQGGGGIEREGEIGGKRRNSCIAFERGTTNESIFTPGSSAQLRPSRKSVALPLRVGRNLAIGEYEPYVLVSIDYLVTWVPNIEMPFSQQQSRINLAELRMQIVKRLGPDKAHRYFSHLNRLLGQRLSKVEFDKLCCLTIGRENLSLHNQFIQSILKNACNGKVPPPPPVNGVTTLLPGVERTIRKEDGARQSLELNAPNAVVLANGEIRGSFQRGRSVKRDRKLVDRPGSLGPNGRTKTVTAQQGGNIEENVCNVADNGDRCEYDLQRPIHHQEGLTEQLDNERSSSFLPPSVKRPRLRKSPHDQLYVNNKGLTEIGLEDAEPVTSDYFQIRSLIRSPLGIPFCAGSLGGSCKAPCHGLRDLPSPSNYLNSFDRGELPDTETLRKRMDHIAEAQGLQGVTIDCANLLNNGLDAYLKKLIGSCIELSRARSRSELTKAAMQKLHNYGKVAQGINGMWQNNFVHSHTGIVSVDGTWEIKSRLWISLEDFRVAMELNRQQLGNDWPLLLEKISFSAFEEE